MVPAAWQRSVAWLVVCVSMAFMHGCRTLPVRLCAGMIQNESGRDLNDVRVEHLPTRRVIQTRQILAGTSFRLGFDERAMEAEQAQLRWNDPKLGARSAEVILPRDGTGGTGPQTLVYRIDGAGRVEVLLTPCR